MLVSLDPNQPAPLYVESNAKPDVSEVRLVLTQPVTTDLDDLDLFISRRAGVCVFLSTLNGEIGDPTPISLTRPWSNGWSDGFGPLS